jgi:hypothetical protein
MKQLRVIFKRIILLSITALTLTSCQTNRTPRAASEYLYSTDKSQTQLLEDLKTKLTENKYVIKSMDIETGFLTTQPRAFTIGSGDEKIRARQTVQIRQEGGGVKIRSIYECEYEHKGTKAFEPCVVEDDGANQKIQRIEGALLKLIRENLNKHND